MSETRNVKLNKKIGTMHVMPFKLIESSKLNFNFKIGKVN